MRLISRALGAHRRSADLELDATTKIPELALLLDSYEPVPETIRYFRNAAGEKAPVYGLLKTDKVAVAWSVVPDGMVFDEHIHETEREWIVVFDGKLIYRDEDREVVLEKGDGLDVSIAKPHSVEAVDGDAFVIALTIPPSEAFPDGP